MSIQLTVNGITYNYPELDDEGWGPDATNWALAITQGVLTKAGGLFTLTGELDLGPNFGIKSVYYKSRSSNIAQAGQIRLSNSDVISFRNSGNSANLNFGPGSTDAVPQWNSVDLVNVSTAQTLTNKTLTSPTITNPTFTGTATFVNLSTSGTTTIGDAPTDSLIVNAGVASDILPLTDATYNLGSSSKQWLAANLVNLNVTNAAHFADGSSSIPSITFTSDTDTGIYRASANALGLTTGGIAALVLDSSQNAVFTGSLHIPNGTAGVPSISFTSETNTGIFRPSGSTLGFSVQGSQKAQFTASALEMSTFLDLVAGTASQPGLAFVSDTNTGLYSISDGVIGVSTNGVSNYVFSPNGITSTKPIYEADGTVSAPSYSFSSSTNTGIFSSSANQLAIAANGTLVFVARDTSVRIPNVPLHVENGTVSVPTYTFENDIDTGLYSEAANTLGITAGGIEQLSITDGFIRIGSIALSKYFVVGATGVVPTAELTASNAGEVVLASVNTSTSSGSVAIIEAFAAVDASGVDAFSRYDLGDTTFWSTGVRGNGTGGRYRIAHASGLSSNVFLDIATSGIVTLSAQLQAANGNSATPGLSFSGDASTGVYLPSGGNLALSTSGTDRLVINSSSMTTTVKHLNINGVVAAPSYSFTNDTSAGMYLAAAGTVAFSVGGTNIADYDSGAFRIFTQTLTADGSVGNPAYSFISDLDTGIYRSAANTIAFAAGGINVGTVDNTSSWNFGTSGVGALHNFYTSGITLTSSGGSVLTQESITNTTLADNTTNGIVNTYPSASNAYFVIDYGAVRGANKETGTIHIVSDGTTPQLTTKSVTIGDIGTTFTVDISGGNVRLKYTTTSTGTAVTMHFAVRRWN